MDERTQKVPGRYLLVPPGRLLVPPSGYLGASSARHRAVEACAGPGAIQLARRLRGPVVRHTVNAASLLPVPGRHLASWRRRAAAPATVAHPLALRTASDGALPPSSIPGTARCRPATIDALPTCSAASPRTGRRRTRPPRRRAYAGRPRAEAGSFGTARAGAAGPGHVGGPDDPARRIEGTPADDGSSRLPSGGEVVTPPGLFTSRPSTQLIQVAGTAGLAIKRRWTVGGWRTSEKSAAWR